VSEPKKRKRSERTPTSDREAMRYVYAVLSLEITDAVDSQLDANPQLAKLPVEFRRKMLQAAERLSDDLFRKAGKRIPERIFP
jgi:hypothetical protein